MKDKIDIVAKAMADVGYIDGDEVLKKYVWDKLPEDARDYWRRKAKAALDALEKLG